MTPDESSANIMVCAADVAPVPSRTARIVGTLAWILFFGFILGSAVGFQVFLAGF